MLRRRQADFIEPNNILDEKQAGFRKGYGTAVHKLFINVLFICSMPNVRNCFVLFVNYQKAVTAAWRDGLWVKLLNPDISGKILHVIPRRLALGKTQYVQQLGICPMSLPDGNRQNICQYCRCETRRESLPFAFFALSQ